MIETLSNTRLRLLDKLSSYQARSAEVHGLQSGVRVAIAVLLRAAEHPWFARVEPYRIALTPEGIEEARRRGLLRHPDPVPVPARVPGIDLAELRARLAGCRNVSWVGLIGGGQS